jgi:hypothetical protein
MVREDQVVILIDYDYCNVCYYVNACFNCKCSCLLLFIKHSQFFDILIYIFVHCYLHFYFEMCSTCINIVVFDKFLYFAKILLKYFLAK